jgi:AcrR family transcriptional regulator
MARVIKDPEERRKELIDTAERLFVSRGYEQTAISDIVKEVGVSQGTFYYYFDSKEDVLVAVLERNIAVMESDFIQIAKRSDLDEAVKLNSMINTFIDNSTSGKKILGYIHDDKNKALHRKLIRIRPLARISPAMADVISNGVSKGRFNVARPMETSYLLLMLIASALHMFYHPEALRESRGIGQGGRVDHDNMRMALEDALSRVLGVSDYRFSLQI